MSASSSDPHIGLVLRTHLAVALTRVQLWIGARAQPEAGRAWFVAKGQALIALRWQALAEATGGPASRWSARSSGAADLALAALARAGTTEGELVAALRSFASPSRHSGTAGG